MLWLVLETQLVHPCPKVSDLTIEIVIELGQDCAADRCLGWSGSFFYFPCGCTKSGTLSVNLSCICKHVTLLLLFDTSL